MNNYRKQYRSWQFLGTAIITLWLVIIMGNSHAATINLSANQCEVSMTVVSADCDAGQCSGDSTCVCASKGDFVIWNIAGDDKFKMKFSGDSPLKDNCGKNFKGKKHKCKVKDTVSKGQSYSYEIYLERCSNGTDPRIIIKS